MMTTMMKVTWYLCAQLYNNQKHTEQCTYIIIWDIYLLIWIIIGIIFQKYSERQNIMHFYDYCAVKSHK